MSLARDVALEAVLVSKKSFKKFARLRLGHMLGTMSIQGSQLAHNIITVRPENYCQFAKLEMCRYIEILVRRSANLAKFGS